MKSTNRATAPRAGSLLRPALLLPLVAACAAIACSTTLTGRQQLTLLPESTLAEMGRATFQDLKQQGKVDPDPATNAYVRCVVDALLDVIPKSGPAMPASWEVVVFQDPTPNAFALPGGRIGVHTGMLQVAQTPDQLAAVLGHEIGHVLLQHGNERASQTLLAQTAISAGSLALGGMDPAEREAIVASLGVGAQYGVLLPFSRTHESEADEVGQEFMADAGFDPRAAVTLWQRMAQAGGQAPPEFLSTHPAPATRIAQLEKNLPETLPRYEKARQAGRHPDCVAPVRGS